MFVMKCSCSCECRLFFALSATRVRPKFMPLLDPIRVLVRPPLETSSLHSVPAVPSGTVATLNPQLVEVLKLVRSIASKQMNPIEFRGPHFDGSPFPFRRTADCDHLGSGR